MQGAYFQLAGEAGDRPQAIERRVIDNVPYHRQGGEQNAQSAHLHYRALHQPGGGRGEDQRRQSFEGDGVDNAFGERLALMWGLLHGELPPVLA